MDKKKIQKKTIPVKGMHCKNCSSKISKKLKDLDGIKDVNVDMMNDMVSVSYDNDTVNIKDIKDRINSIGYDAGGKGNRTLAEGIVYGLVPHIGCIAFIIGSVVGVTVLMEAFKLLLMNPYFFHILIAISIGFATLSSVVYLKKNDFFSMTGIKKKKTYLSTMYGSTIGINLVLFFLVFPLLANISSAPLTGALTTMAGTETISISVEIPCPGHAPLISEELKTIGGVLSVQFSYPNIFDVYYDSERTNIDEMLSLEVFDTYKPSVLEEVGSKDTETASKLVAVSSLDSQTETDVCDGSCGGSCGRSSCGCGGF